MSLWERFQRLEVLKKRLNVQVGKVKKYLASKEGNFVKENIAFIVLYGIMVNLALYLIFNAEISILNSLGGGCLYYVFTDVVKLLSEKKFILFK